MKRFFIFIFSLISMAFVSHAQPRNHSYNIIAYYLGSPANVARVDPTKITHIIFSFCHLKGNRLHVASATDSLTIKRLVGLKKKNPNLKVLLSMGGWGACARCSDTFADSVNRLVFAESVRKLSRYFKTDGIDLDWEYPAVEGPPGHKFVPEDREHFTQLLKQLRETLGDDYEISFAAGGFQEYLEKSIDWPRAMKFADRVNLMTYDLVNGNSVFTGHHTSLYSTPQSPESINNAVQYIIGQGVPPHKIVIGAAFYGRMWENVETTNHGLYQPGKFKRSVVYKALPHLLSASNGYTVFWNDTAKAPWAYNAAKKLFITYDNKRSVTLKTQYVIDHNLNGIMFWQILHDMSGHGLFETINQVIGNK